MKLQRFFKGVFALGCLTAFITTLSSCMTKKDDKKEDDKISEIYQAYVLNAEENGEEPLKYEEWLKTIKGSDGKNGENGLSAFEIYKKYHPEYTGTEQEWIDSLVGAQGQNGKSAYELAVENGYKGTEEQWLASLAGTQGQNGKSAYELAVDNGYTGTMSEWLSSLIGSQGQSGKSAYEIAVENGFIGTEEEWLASLAAAPSPGNKIKDVAIKTGYNEKGEQIFIFTFTMEDGSTISSSTPIPKTIISINGLVNDRFEMIAEGDKKPTLEINVNYSDNTSGVIEVTEDMILKGNIDFTTAGSYDIYIGIGGFRTSYTVTVYDPNVLVLESAYLNINSFILLQSEVEQQNVYTYPIQWQLTYTNGKSVNAEIELDLSSLDLQTPGEHMFEVNYEQFSSNVTVYIMTDEEMQNLTPSYVCVRSFDNPIFVKYNEAPDLSKVWIEYLYDVNGNTILYYEQAALEKLEGLDTSILGSQDVTVKGYNDRGYAQFFIYDSVVPTTNVSIHNVDNNCIRVTSSFPDIDLFITEGKSYSAEYNSYFVLESEKTIKLTSEMIINDIDFSVVGDKTIQISYNNQTFELYLWVYDPNITNVQNMHIMSFSTPNYIIGQSTIDDIKNDIIGKTLFVSLFEKVDGEYYLEVPITEEMIDLSFINMNNLGFQSFTISYMGFVIQKEINMMVDLSTASVYKTLNYAGNDETLDSKSLILYENGYGELDGIQFSYELIKENTAIYLKQNNKKMYAFAIKLEDNTFNNYDFSADTLIDTYTYDTGDGILTIEAYENGLANVSQGQYSMIYGYELEGDQVMIYSFDSINHFVIVENNILIKVE